ncbi:hypothetical protein CHPC1041_0049 [Streptococcus phage CHPC1041]|uniref:Uncharacterized protein n=1 Tax=Streptococcus phage CHPC1041 TaxID=2365015 RepID=A0A3G8F9M9_9CAUD|nr:membrane protein [Streptococcus phage CHPC1041]AZF91507.1 hypothetical protein CHPC1041_0049 [Streptococcus phage CHPC1041]
MPEVIIAICILFPISVVLSGFTITYGWNNILASIAGVPKITIIQAIGLYVLVSFIVSSGRDSSVENFVELCFRVLLLPVTTLLVFWMVTLFM